MISIIVPVYNVEKYLQECLTSIKNQTYKDIEIIMVNDGSTDESEKICRSFVKNDKRFILINQENQGVCEARNRGVQKSKGEYISFIDSDDTVVDDFLESLLKALEENDTDMAQCDRWIDGIKEHPYWDTRIFQKHEIFPEYLKNSFYNNICVKLYKRKLVENVPFPLGRPIMEDASWTSHVFEKCNAVARIADAKYNYRMVPSSQTHTKLSERKECGKFRNQIEKATVIERHVDDKDSLDNLYSMVMEFTPWILGSYDDLNMFDTYDALRILISRLCERGYHCELFGFIQQNPDFRKAQDAYLLYGLKKKDYDLKYKMKIIYRRIKKR